MREEFGDGRVRMDEFVFETEKVRQPPRTSPQVAAVAPSIRMAEVSQEVAAAIVPLIC